MKSYRAFLRLIVLIFFFFQINGLSAQHRVILLHPTVGNIENIIWMTEHKIIDIPGIEWIGVYHEKEAYNYSQSEQYLNEKAVRNCKLLKVEGEISPDEIFKVNSCTKTFNEIVAKADAIFFFGGPDIQPSIYGEKQHLLTVVTDPNRHIFEVSFFFHMIGGTRNPAFKPLLSDKPEIIVRAFCLGMQTMNVAAGGTLLQDIPQQRYHKQNVEDVMAIKAENRHRNYNTLLYQDDDLMWGFFHPLKISSKGFLNEIAAKCGQNAPTIYSSHHQAVRKKGKALDVIALSHDGKIIEALQHKTFKNVVGVQFHPEPSMLYQPITKVKLSPTEEFSPNEFLLSKNSLGFHQAFWKDFSERVMSIKTR
jgi:putative glutamine amidotransferase